MQCLWFPFMREKDIVFFYINPENAVLLYLHAERKAKGPGATH